MSRRWMLGVAVGLIAGMILSAYQYFGPLRYVGFVAAAGLFAANLSVGTAAGLAAAVVWKRGGLPRALAGLGICAVVVACWGHWNVRHDLDVVMLVSDAVRADHTSAYGYQRETTPSWKALAHGKGGVLFETAVAQGTVTSAGGPALLTGLYQWQTGYYEPDEVVPDQVETLAEDLHALGYETYAKIANPHLSAERGFAQGFSVFEDLPWSPLPGAEPIAADFVRWYETQKPRRLFALLFFVDTHVPYRASPEDVLRFRPEWKYVEPDWQWRLQAFGPAEREDVTALFDAALFSTDRASGRVFEALRRAGALDRTLVVVTADHGQEFWDRGSVAHGKKPYEDQVRIPLIMHFPSPVRFPQIRPIASLSGQPAAQVDVMPTILQLLGGGPPRDGMGESLLPYVFGRRRANPKRGILSERRAPETHDFAWREGQYKLILTESRQGKSVGLELYDLAADPKERVNLAKRKPEIAASLLQDLEHELSRGPVYSHLAARKELSAESRKTLKALGYLR